MSDRSRQQLNGPETAHGLGRIPFRIRIGVTGHRGIPNESDVRQEVRSQLARIRADFAARHTDVRFTVVSQLAEGADRLVVQEALVTSRDAGEPGRLEVVLPLRAKTYIDVQKFNAQSRRDFEQLLQVAATCSEPPGNDPTSSSDFGAAYESASKQVVERRDLLIALWDGGRSGGRGGTAETLLYAAAQSIPCIWISTEGEIGTKDNLAQGEQKAFYTEVRRRSDVKHRSGGIEPPSFAPTERPGGPFGSLRASLASLDKYNASRLPDDYLSQSMSELRSPFGSTEWVVRPFTRASLLAGRWQRRFKLASRLITFFAALAAVMLAISLSFGQGSTIWPLAEAALFAAALIGLVIVRRHRFHSLWLSYRVLAERLRSAHFLAPLGRDFRWEARLEAVYIGDQSKDWLQRAFEEVWDSRPQARRPDSGSTKTDPEKVRRWLADDWIEDQILYHERRAAHHGFWQRVLVTSVAALFSATIVFAGLHSAHLAEDVSTFFSIVLPAVGASLGVLLSINQHEALSQRYSKMRDDLGRIRLNVLTASPDALHKASADAARVMTQETGDWLGAMWFLDIEHP